MPLMCSEEDLKAIQRLIARYFAEKATALADLDYAEKGYTADDFVEILTGKRPGA